jgi:hypothetical protein
VAEASDSAHVRSEGGHVAEVERKGISRVGAMTIFGVLETSGSVKRTYPWQLRQGGSMRRESEEKRKRTTWMVCRFHIRLSFHVEDFQASKTTYGLI